MSHGKLTPLALDEYARRLASGAKAPAVKPARGWREAMLAPAKRRPAYGSEPLDTIAVGDVVLYFLSALNIPEHVTVLAIRSKKVQARSVRTGRILPDWIPFSRLRAPRPQLLQNDREAYRRGNP